MTQCIAEVQVDLQWDQKVSDLEEVIFHTGVTMERGCSNALKAMRTSQLTAYGKRFHEGERQMRWLQEEVKTMRESQTNDARMEAPSELHSEVNSGLLRLEGELQKQQNQYERMREDNYLDQVREMV